jgi:peptidoglycan-associated lipoprotein
MIRRLLLTILAPAALLLAVSGCGPKYPACDKDDHCHEGEYCVNNKCQQCRTDGDCADGESCRSGACRPAGYCETNADCGPGQACRDNLCGPCLAATDCAPDQACVDGACVAAECQTDAECPAGLSCQGRRCVAQQPASTGTTTRHCELDPVFFDFDSSQIDEETRAVLQRNYECLLATGADVTLEGHCDPRGTTEYNMALGDRRARRTKKVLKAMGVDGNRLEPVSKGEEEADGYNARTYAEDRRVDFE